MVDIHISIYWKIIINSIVSASNKSTISATDHWGNKTDIHGKVATSKKGPSISIGAGTKNSNGGISSLDLISDLDGLSVSIAGGTQIKNLLDKITRTENILDPREWAKLKAKTGSLVLLLAFAVANDITGVGVADDFAVVPLLAALMLLFKDAFPDDLSNLGCSIS